MVAGNDDNWHTHVEDGTQGVVEKINRVAGRRGPVVYVASDQQRVGPPIADNRYELLENDTLFIEEPHAVERSPEMPVCSVDEAYCYDAPLEKSIYSSSNPA